MYSVHSTEFLEDTQPIEVTYVDGRVPKKLISVRFDNETIESLKAVTRTKGIGYQTLIRLWVNERLAQEQTGKVS